MIDAVGFDLGDTLLCYEGTPLDWSSLYEPALAGVATGCGLTPSKSVIADGCEILSRYNTRLAPRELEVQSDQIFSALFEAWGVPAKSELLASATERFFNFFQQRMCCYPATANVLNTLRARGVPVGIVTDVPYGMPAQFVQRDLCAAGIADLVNAVVTSVEIGWRKPNTAGFIALASRLGTTPDRMLFVGNEPKDVTGACRAGARAIFLDHEASGANYGQHGTIRRLDELLGLLGNIAPAEHSPDGDSASRVT